jgi:hypothetical protein
MPPVSRQKGAHWKWSMVDCNHLCSVLVSFCKMLRRRFPTLSSSNSIHSNLHEYESSEDEGEGLGLEEKEQERQLSKIHGEAPEAPNSSAGQKRQLETDADIANALSNGATQKKRKQRIVLTERKLTGGEGLIKIRHDFPTKLKYRQVNVQATRKVTSKTNKEQLKAIEIQAAARYASDLMNAYQEFAMDLMPNDHHDDTLLKIQDLGSKKAVRDYLDEMRQDICRGHLEKIHGKDKTENLLDELEHGLTATKTQLLESDEEGEIDNSEKPDKSGQQPPRRASKEVEVATDEKDTSVPLPIEENGNNEGDDEEEEAQLDGITEVILPKKKKSEEEEENSKSNELFADESNNGSESKSTHEDEHSKGFVVNEAILEGASGVDRPTMKENSDELHPEKNCSGPEKESSLANDVVRNTEPVGNSDGPDVDQGLRKSEKINKLNSFIDTSEQNLLTEKNVTSISLEDNKDVPLDNESDTLPPSGSMTNDHSERKGSQQEYNTSESLIEDLSQTTRVEDDPKPADGSMIVEMSQASETPGQEKLVMDSSQIYNCTQDTIFSETQTIVANVDTDVEASQDY